LGKTTLAAASRSVGGTWSRIQFTPDLLPVTITACRCNQRAEEFAFRPGGVFANVVLADEVNRGTRKRSPRCWEVMAERTVTVDSIRHEVPGRSW